MYKLALIAVVLLHGCANRLSLVTETEPEGIDEPAGTDACAGWDDTLAAANRADIQRLGLWAAQNIVEGHLAAPVSFGTEAFATLTIDTVHYGAHFLAGEAPWVPLSDAEAATLELPGRFIMGFGGNRFPIRSDDPPGPVFWASTAIIPAAERASVAPYLRYRSEGAEHIAVARIVGQDASRTEFEVLDAITGALPSRFEVNWSHSAFDVSFPGVGPEEYLVSVDYVAVAGAVTLGPLRDIRLHTPNARAEIESELADPLVLFSAADLEPAVEHYRLGWSFKRAPHVFATTVSGIAEECCTGAGGRYVAHRIDEVLQGQTDPQHVLTGGHGYYGPEACDDGYLLALHEVGTPGNAEAPALSCETLAWLPPDFSGQHRGSTQLPNTLANRLQLEGWLDAAPPVLRLHDPSAPLPSDAWSPVGNAEPWSVPAPNAEFAVRAGRHLVAFRIEAADPGPFEGTHIVTISTTFSPYWYDHLTVHTGQLALSCPDPRLLEVGREWLGAFVVDGEWWHSQGALAYQRAFLVPGVLFDNVGYVNRTLNAVVR